MVIKGPAFTYARYATTEALKHLHMVFEKSLQHSMLDLLLLGYLSVSVAILGNNCPVLNLTKWRAEIE